MSSLYRPRINAYRLRDGSYRTPDGERITKGMKGAVKRVSVCLGRKAATRAIVSGIKTLL
jgi:hypothetical protein